MFKQKSINIKNIRLNQKKANLNVCFFVVLWRLLRSLHSLRVTKYWGPLKLSWLGSINIRIIFGERSNRLKDEILILTKSKWIKLTSCDDVILRSNFLLFVVTLRDSYELLCHSEEQYISPLCHSEERSDVRISAAYSSIALLRKNNMLWLLRSLHSLRVTRKILRENLNKNIWNIII